jgi:hypothetical protein
MGLDPAHRGPEEGLLGTCPPQCLKRTPSQTLRVTEMPEELSLISLIMMGWIAHHDDEWPCRAVAVVWCLAEETGEWVTWRS